MEALQCPREIAIRARFRLIQIRILHRSYASRTFCHRIGHSTSVFCLRGCGEVGSFFHILWDCPKMREYWHSTVEIMSEVVGAAVPLDARWQILGVTGDVTWSRWDKVWLALATVMAKRNIVRLWGADLAPTVEGWIHDLNWCQRAEQVIYQSRGCPQKWGEIWKAWRMYRGDLLMDPGEGAD